MIFDAYFAQDRAVMKRMGEIMRQRRIGAQMTQKQLAKQAAVAVSSVASLEKGSNCSLLTIIQVLRTLHSFDLLEPFFREEEVSPIAYAEALSKHRARKRVRASKKSITIKHESKW